MREDSNEPTCALPPYRWLGWGSGRDFRGRLRASFRRDHLPRAIDSSSVDAPPGGTALTPATITVGGIAAPIDFIGIPATLVGVVQVNFQVPSGIPIGNVPVVVTIGAATSVTVYLNVAN